MIWLDINDIKSILVIISSLVVNISLLYYPFLAIFKDRNKFLPYFITTSISFYVLIGYIFYCLRSLNIYPAVFIIIFSILNMFLFSKNKLIKQPIKFTIDKSQIILIVSFLLCASMFFYYFFYDSIHTVTPDNYYDVYNHIEFFKSIQTYGQISMAYYAPGFHIIFYHAFLLLQGPNIYRFIGPVLGLLITLNIYLMSSLYFNRKSSRLLLILLVIFPLFKLLSIQYITTWPTTLSYLFLPILIAPIFYKGPQTTKTTVLYATSLSAFSLTLPYALLQYVPATIIACLSLIFMSGSHKKNVPYKKYLIQIVTITMLSVLIPATHVFIQTKVISKNSNFPEIQILKKENDKLIISDVYNNQNESIKMLANNDNDYMQKVTSTFLLPFIETIKSAIFPKVVVPINKYSLKTYLYIILTIVLGVVSIYLKDRRLFVISVYSVIWGTISQIGFLELTQYRGRTGPYLVFLSTFLVAYIYDKLAPKTTKFVIPLFILILGLILVQRPLRFDREGVCPGIFEQVKLISEQNTGKNINIIYQYRQIAIVSSNIDAFSLDPKSLEQTKRLPTYLILQQNYCDQSPQDLLRANIHDPTYQYSQVLKQQYLENAKKAVSEIQKSEEFRNFNLYWEDDNIKIYSRPITIN